MTRRRRPRASPRPGPRGRRAPTPTVPLPEGCDGRPAPWRRWCPWSCWRWPPAALHRRLGGHRWDRVGEDLAAVSAGSLALAGVATALSYLAMTGYDGLALRYVGHRVPYRRYAAASFVATASGTRSGPQRSSAPRCAPGPTRPGASRPRRAPGWPPSTSSPCRSAAPPSSPPGPSSRPGTWRRPSACRPRRPSGWGVGLGAVLPAYVLWAGSGKPPVVLRRVRVERPSRALAVAQAVVSVVEWLAMALVLWALLPRTADVGFAAFALVFVVATTAGW